MNTTSLLIGNASSLLAMISDYFSATRKTAKGILWVQIISQFFYFLGSVVLKGYSSAVQNVISIIRNLVAINNIQSKFLERLLFVLGIVLGLTFNNLGVMGLLPVIANLQYTLCVFKFKGDERALKISFAVTCAFFAVFNIAILNFVGVSSNLIIIIATIVILTKEKRK